MGTEKEDNIIKEEKKEEEEEIVLKVDMHCEACARKVARLLTGFEGVEEVRADYKASKVVVKGKAKAKAKADPIKVCQRIQKKSGRKVEIVSPLPKPPQQNKVLQQHHPQNNKEEEEEPHQKQKEEPPPAVVTVVLKVRMHCEACAQALQKRIGKVKGVESVTTDVANDQITVKGVELDPDKLVADIYKKTGKQASIVVKDNEENPKEEEEEEEEKKAEEKDEEKKQAGEEEDDDDKKTQVKKMEYYLPQKYYNYMEQHASYAPQMFSDENPNACSLM